MVKQETHIFRGMQRDMTVSKFNPNYYFEAQNIRLTSRDNNTLLSVINERGTKEIPILNTNKDNYSIEGTLLGYTVLNSYVILFLHISDSLDKIIRLEDKDTYFECIELYTGDLNFNNNNPIESIGLYENENIQKVYWIDGINQPRVINIMDISNNINKFDFIRDISLEYNINIKVNTKQSGQFNSGVIQYACSYFDKYGQESNIFYESPLYYAYMFNRGGSPEEVSSNSFNIELSGLDTNFQYVRLYSIFRTSINATPTVKVVNDFRTNEPIRYTDLNTTGYTIDPTVLLYTGGESLVANTMTHKDNTLFLGNYSLVRPSIPLSIKSAIKGNSVKFVSKIAFENLPLLGNYQYESQLKYNSEVITTFKGGETYRFGVQFQYKTGKWSEVCYIGDFTSDFYPITSYLPGSGLSILLSQASYSLSSSVINELSNIGYKKVRGVVVYPNNSDRNIIAQGVVNPTLYKKSDRENSSKYAISSWFFRPDIKDTDLESDPYKGSFAEFRDQRSVNIDSLPSRNWEIGVHNDFTLSYNVDSGFLTFHSPDIEFNNINLNDPSLKFRIIGYTKLGGLLAYREVTTSTPTLDGGSQGYLAKFPSLEVTGSDLSKASGGRLLKSSINWWAKSKGDSTSKGWLISPWQRSGSIIDDVNSSDNTPACMLQYNRTSNLRYAFENVYNKSFWNKNISNIAIANTTEPEIIRIYDSSNNQYNYLCTIDDLILPSRAGGEIGSSSIGVTEGLTEEEIYTGDIDSYGSTLNPVSIKYKSTKHAVFKFEDSNNKKVILPNPYGTTTNVNTVKTVSYDGTIVTTTTKYRQEYNPLYQPVGQPIVQDTSTKTDPYTQEGSTTSSDTVEYNTIWVVGTTFSTNTVKDLTDTWEEENKQDETDFIPIYSEEEPELVMKYYKDYTIVHKDYTRNKYTKTDITKVTSMTVPHTVDTDGESTNLEFYAKGTNTYVNDNLLWIGEIYRDNVSNKFGGNDDTALSNNNWVVAGRAFNLTDSILYTQGDTYFQRYDCLKTYPYTFEDPNCVTEILSFFCETRVNIDGRYDRNRGNLNNTGVSPTNFNLLNQVYSQGNNFFTSIYQTEDILQTNNFKNQITWSKEKTNAELIDTWTNITLASTIDLDGDKGEIVSLNIFNNEIYCFQDKGLSNILFNNRVQIPTSDGVPIEITNGLKVSGKRYISNSIGCNNKWSIIESPSGLYFIDDITNSLYLFNGKISSLSDKLGFRQWIGENNTGLNWDPINYNNFRTFYDKNNDDVYFVNKNKCLCYSELLEQFVSFMNYESVPAMFNVGPSFYSIKNNKLWKNFEGDYNMFYGEFKPYSITIIANQEEPYDKIYNTIEFRSDRWRSNNSEEYLVSNKTFDTLEVWNEYQKGISELVNIAGKPSSLKKKFRVWRANIPRFNIDWNGVKSNNRDRIRNTWAFIKLSSNDINTDRNELHDIIVHYSI